MAKGDLLNLTLEKVGNVPEKRGSGEGDVEILDLRRKAREGIHQAQETRRWQ